MASLNTPAKKVRLLAPHTHRSHSRALVRAKGAGSSLKNGGVRGQIASMRRCVASSSRTPKTNRCTDNPCEQDKACRHRHNTHLTRPFPSPTALHMAAVPTNTSQCGYGHTTYARPAIVAVAKLGLWTEEIDIMNLLCWGSEADVRAPSPLGGSLSARSCQPLPTLRSGTLEPALGAHARANARNAAHAPAPCQVIVVLPLGEKPVGGGPSEVPCLTEGPDV